MKRVLFLFLIYSHIIFPAWRKLDEVVLVRMRNYVNLGRYHPDEKQREKTRILLYCIQVALGKLSQEEKMIKIKQILASHEGAHVEEARRFLEEQGVI